VAFLERQGVTNISDVMPEHVAGFCAELQETPSVRGGPLSKSFLQQALLSVRGLLVWASKRGLLFGDFSDIVIPKRDDGSPAVPSVAVMKRLLKLPQTGCPRGERDRLLLELLYVLGLRIGEAVKLDVHHADLAAANLIVTGKGGHQRLLPLSPKLSRILLDYLTEWRPRLDPPDSEKALLVSRNRKRLGKAAASLRVRLYGAQLGIKLSPHQLRHACATHLLEGQAELPDISRLLGHKRLESTQRYARAQSVELAREHRHCHPRASSTDHD
jgi:integrase/recombinase XerD